MSNTSRPAGDAAATAPSGPIGRSRLPRDIKVMLVAAFLIALGFGLVAPVLPQFATTFDVGATAAAVIVSIFAFMRLVFAPAGGALIVKLGERPVYVAGLLIVAASTAACAFAQDYWQLLVFRGLGGAGSVMFTVASMALVVRLAPPESRGRVSGAYASAFLIGNVCGPIVGGLLASFGNASGVVAIPDLMVLARKGSLYVTRPTGAHYFSERAALLEGARLLFAAVADGSIKVEVSHRFPLAQAADAHRALEARQTTGSVVLIP